MITGAHARGRYFDADLRSVKEAGVRHVMRLFFTHATTVTPGMASDADKNAAAREDEAADQFLDKLQNVVQVICDEEALRS